MSEPAQEAVIGFITMYVALVIIIGGAWMIFGRIFPPKPEKKFAPPANPILDSLMLFESEYQPNPSKIAGSMIVDVYYQLFLQQEKIKLAQEKERLEKLYRFRHSVRRLKKKTPKRRPKMLEWK